jgi:hypothetical protein
MNEKQVFALVVIVAVYLYWHSRGMSKYRTTGPGGGNAAQTGSSASSGGPNTVFSNASTAPRTRRQLPSRTSPWQGGGRGYTSVPVFQTGQLVTPQARAVGGSWRQRGTLSRSSSSVGTVAISPRWPRNQVNSRSLVRLGNGSVQVPGWAAAPTLVSGPGGQGTVIYGGS